MSNLEKLPTELLEKVFFFCMSLDLPRSSPIIAGKLSSELIFMQAVNSAFEDTWNWHSSLLPEPRDSVVFFRRNAQHQSDLFRCRWLSLPRILKAKGIWLKRKGVAGVLEQPCGFQIATTSSFVADAQADFLEFDLLGTRKVEKEPLPENVTPEEYFNLDFEKFCLFAESSDAGFELSEQGYGINSDSTHDVAPGLEIPSVLLEGLWTEDSTQLLFWLARSGARIDWINSTNGEVSSRYPMFDLAKIE